jgi:hypothetical protein
MEMYQDDFTNRNVLHLPAMSSLKVKVWKKQRAITLEKIDLLPIRLSSADEQPDNINR